MEQMTGLDLKIKEMAGRIRELREIENLLKSAGFKRVITAFTGCMISLHSGRNALGIHFISENQL
jgi:fatty acid-binding protein DegV